MLVRERYATNVRAEASLKVPGRGKKGGRVEHLDHVMLLQEGMAGSGPHAGEVWADLGSGKGAFTLALADLLGAGAVIHSVDRDERALQTQREAMDARFPDASVEYRRAGLPRPPPPPPSCRGPL